MAKIKLKQVDILHNRVPGVQGGDATSAYHLSQPDYVAVQSLIAGGTANTGTGGIIDLGSRLDTGALFDCGTRL